MMFQTAEALRRADAGDDEAYALLRVLTPLLKFRACRDARKVAGDAMEVRGGCGYVEEFPDGHEISRHSQRLIEKGLDPSRLHGGGEGVFIVRAKGETEVASLREAMVVMRKAGQEGLSLQRYKGLGEMNASQLWETTMEPGTRTLLRVCLEDAVRADEMFSILMGSSVEDRRKFIEKHALDVRDLDV